MRKSKIVKLNCRKWAISLGNITPNHDGRKTALIEAIENIAGITHEVARITNKNNNNQ